MACVNGSKLSAATRADVLNRYGYRWTLENEKRARQWHGRLEPPTAPLVSDSEWLAGHAFHIKADGSLDERRNRAEPACLADDWQPEPAARPCRLSLASRSG